MLDEKLSFTEHVTAVQKKSQQRLHVLRKLRAFYVDPLLLLRLYRSIIEPLLTYCSICYYPALSVKNRNRLLKISDVSAKIIGLPTRKVSEIIDHAILKKVVLSLLSLITRSLRSSMYFRLKGDTVI